MSKGNAIANNLFLKIRAFIIDYCQRHAHPVNASLHLVGVPIAFVGLYKIFTGSIFGLVLLFFGYLFQYLGHRAQGNEVGEVTLIKKCYGGISQKFKRKFIV